MKIAVHKWMLTLFVAFISAPSMAQLCSGSLGDPVIKIDFGTGSNPQGAALSANQTNYIYQAGDCPNDGLYTIRSNTNSCFNNSWFQITQDHTGNTGGYMMIVNASVSPGDFYVDTVNGLCGGTTYEFAAWIVNLLKQSACGGNGIKPDITFSIETIDGTVLQSYQTGGIASNTTVVWKQYGFYFATPLSISTVVIRMRNNAKGGCGNDLALDDITFRACGPLVTVSLNTGATTSKEICDTDTTTFFFNSNVNPYSASTKYQWQVNANNTTWSDINAAQSSSFTRYQTIAGNYNYRVVVAQGTDINNIACRIASDPVNILVDAKPPIKINTNNPSCYGDTIAMNASGGNTYTWNGPSGFTNNNTSFTIYPSTKNNTGTYYLLGYTSIGCSNIDSTLIALNAVPNTYAGNDTAICEGTTALLHASGGNSYLWSPPDYLSATNIANPLANPIDTTMYIVTASNGSCSRNDSVIINVLKKPYVKVGAAQKIYEGQSVQIIGSVGGSNISYLWTPNLNINNPTTLNPIVSPIQNIFYVLNLTSNSGCGVAKDSVFIRVYNKITIPNGFTPNGDGINDDWYVKALNTYPEAEIKIFDRSGQIVFQCKGYTKKWDGNFNGKPLPIGTYYYLINLYNGLPAFSGAVTIIR